ncbi:hypothetical protein LUZ63_012915 [Rhynchospora breviuscula]|uniref:Uncharacterized protein n=1 Tax=Rhynchospora breviuscula TaxID=2022672 RepID=A0A9Q0C7S0_9POAL|nr:hypothetical protein LUZ63_012915 [Rhynchospora breviuscula]
MNMALLVWFFFVVAGVFLLFLLMTGALNGVITKNSLRKRWIEITNQILNALFTIICLYQHPKLCHHLVQVIRWHSTDSSELRKIYCKNGGSAGPKERVHVAFVVALFHSTCIAQYIYCSLFWGFSLKRRPDWAVNLCMGIGLAAPIIAGLYMIYGPLGKKYTMPDPKLDDDLESQVLQSDSKLILTRPVWIGGLFNFSDDLTVACSSLFCTCCVFGWNMERLGFGNMYVHIFTFLLLCMAPFWVFNVTALMINDEALRYLVGITGILLSFLGLLYGGYWRIQMRKRFGLPSNPFCCGYAGLSDFVRWFFCSPCALAQEVRTGNFYEVEEGGLCLKEKKEEMKLVLAPLERERNTVTVPAVPVLIQIAECGMSEKT